MEGTVEQMDKRMASLETRMASLETRMDSGFREVHQRMTGLETRMDVGFRWIVGIQFTTLVALGTLILVKL